MNADGSPVRTDYSARFMGIGTAILFSLLFVLNAFAF